MVLDAANNVCQAGYASLKDQDMPAKLSFILGYQSLFSTEVSTAHHSFAPSSS